MRLDPNSNVYKALSEIWAERGINVERFLVWIERRRIVSGPSGTTTGSYCYNPVVRNEKFGKWKLFGEHPEFIEVETAPIYTGELVEYFINQTEIKWDKG